MVVTTGTVLLSIHPGVVTEDCRRAEAEQVAYILGVETFDTEGVFFWVLPLWSEKIPTFSMPSLGFFPDVCLCSA